MVHYYPVAPILCVHSKTEYTVNLTDHAWYISAIAKLQFRN